MLLTHSPKDRFKKDALLLCILPTVAMLAALIAVSIGVWINTKQGLVHERALATTQSVDALQDLLTDRITSYEEILRGGSALFETSASVSAQDWHAFISNFNIQSRYPGIRSFGYVPLVNGADAEQFSAAIRSTSDANFTIYPAAKFTTVAPVTYIEPGSDTNRATLGFDLYSDAARKNAMGIASQKNQAALTGKVQPHPGSALPPTPTVLLFFPIYKKDCTAAIDSRPDCTTTGFVYAGFRVNELITGILANAPEFKDTFTIYDGTETTNTNLLYQSINYNQNGESAQGVVNMFSRTWTIRLQVADTSTSLERNRPLVVLISGLALSVAATTFVFMILLKRARSLRAAKDSEVQMVKDDLLALAAHQLRTPATAVKQYTIMALEGYGGDLNKEQKALIQKAYENNERQLRTVNEMLYVANADAGKLRISPRVTDLVSIICDVIDEQRGMIEEKKHSLIEHLPSTPLHYNADELYLRMAISNLLSNAIKYTSESGKITVGLSVNPKTIHIFIGDSGVGITKKQLPQLFNKFTRLDNPLSANVIGSGLGLYLAQKVVQLHKGRIKVSSEYGIGSVFTIILPRRKNDPPGTKPGAPGKIATFKNKEGRT